MDVEDQIPPTLPLQKGGISPLWKRGVRGDFYNNYVFLIMDSFVTYRILFFIALTSGDQRRTPKHSIRAPFSAGFLSLGNSKSTAIFGAAF